MCLLLAPAQLLHPSIWQHISWRPGSGSEETLPYPLGNLGRVGHLPQNRSSLHPRAAGWPGPLVFPGRVRHQSTSLLCTCIQPASKKSPQALCLSFSETSEPLPHREHGHMDLTAVSKKPLHLVFFFLKNIYVFIWLYWVLVAARGIFAASREIFHCSA